MKNLAGHLMLAAGLALGALAFTACQAEDVLPVANDPRLVGSWSTGCFNDAPGGATLDLVETFTITSTTWDLVSYDYSTNNTTCGAGQVLADSGTGPYVTGGSVPATLGVGGTAVTANTIEFHATGFDLYSIYYIDEVANPDVLYIGDETATPGLDATTPSNRPTVLQDWKPRPKVP